MGHIDLCYCDESHFVLTPNVGYAWQHKNNLVLLLTFKTLNKNVAEVLSLVGSKHRINFN